MPSVDHEEKKVVGVVGDEHAHARSLTPSIVDPETPEQDLELQRTQSALPPPPDGGLHAWLKVFGGFFIYINIWYSRFIPLSDVCLTYPTQGKYSSIWRLPNVVQGQFALLFECLCDLLGRDCASLAPYSHWHPVRSAI